MKAMEDIDGNEMESDDGSSDVICGNNIPVSHDDNIDGDVIDGNATNDNDIDGDDIDGICVTS